MFRTRRAAFGPVAGRCGVERGEGRRCGRRHEVAHRLHHAAIHQVVADIVTTIGSARCFGPRVPPQRWQLGSAALLVRRELTIRELLFG